MLLTFLILFLLTLVESFVSGDKLQNSSISLCRDMTKSVFPTCNFFVSDHPWSSQVSLHSYCLSKKQKTLNIMIPKCVNNLSTPNVDLRAQIVTEHAQTVKYNLSTLHRTCHHYSHLCTKMTISSHNNGLYVDYLSHNQYRQFIH